MGYAEVLLAFPDSVNGVEEQLTLVLVAVEYPFNSQIPMLVDTNVLLHLYQPGIDHYSQRGLLCFSKYLPKGQRIEISGIGRSIIMHLLSLNPRVYSPTIQF